MPLLPTLNNYSNLVRNLLWLSGGVLLLTAFLKVPSKLDEHMKQTDSLVVEMKRVEANQRVQICLTAHLATVSQCLSQLP